MKLTINFSKKNLCPDRIATALCDITQAVTDGYTSGIGMPVGVLSWHLRRDDPK